MHPVDYCDQKSPLGAGSAPQMRMFSGPVQWDLPHCPPILLALEGRGSDTSHRRNGTSASFSVVEAREPGVPWFLLPGSLRGPPATGGPVFQANVLPHPRFCPDTAIRNRKYRRDGCENMPTEADTSSKCQMRRLEYPTWGGPPPPKEKRQ